MDDHVAHPPAKRAKAAPRSSSTKEAKELRVPSVTARKLAAPRPKKTPARMKPSKALASVSASERRRSARSGKGETTYVERDDSEDDKEMLEGVAKWDGWDEGQASDNDGEGTDSEAESGSVTSTATPAPAPKQKPKGPAAAPKGSDDSELSDLDSEEIEQDVEEDQADEEEEEEATPPPAKANGKKATARGGATKTAAAPKAKPSPRNGKAKSKAALPAAGKSTRLTRRTKTSKSEEFAMDESDD